jgi:hypothetical protein
MKKFIASSWLMICCLLLCSQLVYTQKDSIRHLYKPEWRDVFKSKPKDQKKWQDFEMFSSVYGKYVVPNEKILPLVFNVIDIKAANKIKESDIQVQINILNDAFAGKIEGWQKGQFESVRARDSKIQFCLGSPNGNKGGVNKTNIDVPFEISTLNNISKKGIGLEGEKKDEFINVWITELPDQMGGFATLPDQNDEIDGIYIDPDYFGLKPNQKYYHSGKTLVHLLGRYLGLQPLWGNGNCEDDGIDDTPIHNMPNARCYEGMHISLCPDNPIEMVGNFMDSNPDDCAYMFTKGQVARMHACLGDYGYRKKLLDSKKVCEPSPIADTRTNTATVVKELDFELAPNPAKSEVLLSYAIVDKNQDLKIEIYNITNQKIYDQKIPPIGENRGQIQIDINNWTQGSYYVKLQNGLDIKTKTLVTIK